jgi:ATP-dependent protease ClpP protease subunit
MVHNGSVSFEAEAEKVRSHVRDAEICDNRYREILSKRSGIPLPKIRALCRREAFLTAAEAVELGLADELEYRD